MVFYFKARPEAGDYTIFMGIDKYENEELIKYGIPEDVWFHVDKMSSAHVYLRLQKGQTIEDISEGVLEDCAQLVKANSIQGNKVNNVDIVYTPWQNLKKTASMDVRQIGFYNSKMVRTVRVEKRVNAIINRLNRTKVERTPDLKAEREAINAAERAQRKLQLREKDENDDGYEEEREVADVFDSDFDEDEPVADEEGENEPDERTRTKKKLIFPGKQSTKKKNNKAKLPSKAENTPKTPEDSTPSEHQDVPDDAEVEKSVRKSTRTSVIIRQAERDAIRAALQATMKPIKRKSVGEEKRMTQEEMLLEAAQTEIMNLRNLEKVLAREEEVKKRAIVHKAVYSGPQIRYHSKNGASYISFMNGSSFESKISNKSTPYPEKAVCAVTGLPAIYRDPKTGSPYATKEAFKIIRERFDQESACNKKESSTGLLSDATYEPGFSRKRKRSVIPHDSETSYFRQFARFRRIPALEMQDSE